MNGGTVLSVLGGKVRPIVVMLLVCMTVMVVAVCQGHAALPDYEYTPSSGHRPTSSTHAALDFSCLVAVLPSMVFFPCLPLFLLYTTPLLLQHALLTFSLFRPPRNGVR